MSKQQRGQEVELTIDAIGFEGIAIGRVDGVVHFVQGGLPGERVRARVVRTHKRRIEAVAVEVLEPSAARVDPPCPVFDACGGCTWQHLAIAEQEHWKRQHVVDSFERLGHITPGIVHPTLGCPEPYGYRNKMEFSFGASRWLTEEQIGSGETFDTSFALGLHIPGRFDKILDVRNCMLQGDVGNVVLAWTHECAERVPVAAYHQRRHDGFARNLVVRTSATTGAVMTILVTTTPSTEAERQFIEAWFDVYDRLPTGSTMAHAVNDTWSPVAQGAIVRQQGDGFLEETSHGVRYRISPFSFFQTNTRHLPNLVAATMDAAAITPGDVVWDLYCGTGTLALPAARRGGHVVGAELVASSIADARANAERNGIDNVTFHTVDLHSPKALPVLQSFPAPDVVIVDPPRAGMHAMVVEHLLAVLPPRIAYVSCNPATQARDCAMLYRYYDVEAVTPVDMFPQTYHVESVAVLRRRPEPLPAPVTEEPEQA